MTHVVNGLQFGDIIYVSLIYVIYVSLIYVIYVSLHLASSGFHLHVNTLYCLKDLYATVVSNRNGT